MVLIVPPAAVMRLGDELLKAGVPSWPIGRVLPMDELDGRQYVELPTADWHHGHGR
jgi:hypothetical protein